MNIPYSIIIWEVHVTVNGNDHDDNLCDDSESDDGLRRWRRRRRWLRWRQWWTISYHSPVRGGDVRREVGSSAWSSGPRIRRCSYSQRRRRRIGRRLVVCFVVIGFIGFIIPQCIRISDSMDKFHKYFLDTWWADKNSRYLLKGTVIESWWFVTCSLISSRETLSVRLKWATASYCNCFCRRANIVSYCTYCTIAVLKQNIPFQCTEDSWNSRH